MKTTNYKRFAASSLHKVWFLMAIIVVGSILPISCSKDKEEDENPENNPNYTGHAILGTWFSGGISGGRYNSVSGRYEGATGIGMVYYFNANGTFSQYIVSNTLTNTWAASITGKYTIKDNLITYSNQVSEVSNDNGKTWGQRKTLANQSNYFECGSDEIGKYVLMGLDGATPPLDPLTNASKLRGPSY